MTTTTVTENYESGVKEKLSALTDALVRHNVVKSAGYALPFIPAGPAADYVGLLGEMWSVDAPLSLTALVTTGTALGAKISKNKNIPEGLAEKVLKFENTKARNDFLKFTFYTAAFAKLVEYALHADKLGGWEYLKEAGEATDWNPGKMITVYSGAVLTAMGGRHLYDHWEDKTKPALKWTKELLNTNTAHVGEYIKNSWKNWRAKRAEKKQKQKAKEKAKSDIMVDLDAPIDQDENIASFDGLGLDDLDE